MARPEALARPTAKECGMGLGERVKNHAIGMAGRADAREAADVLARAFHDDPEFSWMLPVEDTRNRRLRRYFVTELRHGSLRHGGVEVARDGERIAGVAVWFPPGTWSGTQVGALPGYLRAFGRRLGVCARYASVAVRAHPRERPHWYLAIIGVDPSRKGQGVGAALLRSRLERCDKEGTAAYLESSNPQNVPLYEHFGFQVTGVLDLPKGAPAVTTMWRPERSSPPSPVPVTSGKAGEEEAPGCPVAGSAVGGG